MHTRHSYFPNASRSMHLSHPRAKNTVQTLNSSKIRREQKLLRIHSIKLVQLPREVNMLVQALTKTRVRVPLLVAPSKGCSTSSLSKWNLCSQFISGIVGLDSVHSLHTINYRHSEDCTVVCCAGPNTSV